MYQGAKTPTSSGSNPINCTSSDVSLSRQPVLTGSGAGRLARTVDQPVVNPVIIQAWDESTISLLHERGLIFILRFSVDCVYAVSFSWFETKTNELNSKRMRYQICTWGLFHKIALQLCTLWLEIVFHKSRFQLVILIIWYIFALFLIDNMFVSTHSKLAKLVNNFSDACVVSKSRLKKA